MNSKEQLIKILKSTNVYNGLTEVQIKYIVSTIFSIITDQLNCTGKVKVKDFGSLMIKNHKMNPNGIMHTINFKASKNLLKKIN